jgi:hypothetical protein
MTMLTAPRSGRGQQHRSPLIALVVASALLVTSVVMALAGFFGPAPWRPTTTTGVEAPGAESGPLVGGYGGMMSGQIWLPGNDQQVTTIGAARGRAAQAGAGRALHPGEVIQFSNNFYVELKDSAGAATTEVLVDPASGAVQTEPGPAMMWNTGSRTGLTSIDQARRAATAWLDANRPAEKVATIDAYPGYYTVDTQVDGKIAGMLSVNGTTGAVWYHMWHGAFVGMEDD